MKYKLAFTHHVYIYVCIAFKPTYHIALLYISNKHFSSYEIIICNKFTL